MRAAVWIAGILVGLLLAGCHGSGTPAAERPFNASPAQGVGQISKNRLKQDQVVYRVVQRMDVVNKGNGKPDKHNLWIALIVDVPPYQEVLSTDISPRQYTLVTDEYGNQYAEFDLADIEPHSRIPIRLAYTVRVHAIRPDLSVCEGELPDMFNQPELHVESNNPQIVALSEQLREGKPSVCAQVRAFYDYVGDNLVYTYNGQNWGAQAALGEMGADCTEFSSLMMALSRAAGIPARYLEGLSYTPAGEESLARTEHSWLEVYLPGVGWTPMDPTLGRSSMTREDYFAQMPPTHIIITRGRNPSTLRGGNYWTHLYWPGTSTRIEIENKGWEIAVVE
ncbi:MAG: hypothetical protein D6775_15970 [Caldilineae bacterium]|nr:MAG: hypothetical protein D6775_15970 [Caldilineae bacterium]